ncbi:hypothetical protein NCAS_0F03760 [Naumovozyma castellii]|uniref:Histone H2A.Z-specific chaperone CHZ1 n=1 Tax=Naumovozyma castellii TaxID=27288 RepID=G0VH87_NAUCA|nr:hypothetical protein NCAS_0F03760 [Naumovozyma castellii CBS 4309]CCC70860.1 hypothetical protein NCAS_0F03760 [Naumovozyma castellii CBS 4309]
MTDQVKEKRPLEEEQNIAKTNDDASKNKKTKTRRRRRNYDDYDAQVDKQEKETKTKGVPGDDDDEESDADDEKLDMLMGKDVDDEEEDDLNEIDTANIITTGRRTRGKVIDFKKTAEKLGTGNQVAGDGDDEEEEEEDAEFKA